MVSDFRYGSIGVDPRILCLRMPKYVSKLKRKC